MSGDYTKADAKRCGALCDQCAFRRINAPGIVGPERAKNNRAKAVIIGEAPGVEEVDAGQPFIGRSGKMLMNALRAANIKRSEVHITNAIACRPAGNRLDKVTTQLRKLNAERIEQGKEPLLHPIVACRPRLVREIEQAGTSNIVVLGSTALESIVGKKQSILANRGAPLPPFVDHPNWKVFPTLHPAFVLRALRWRHVLNKDLARAIRWFEGRLGWKEPQTLFRPTVEQVRAFLSQKTRFFLVDTETDSLKPLTTNLRCLGVSNADGTKVIVVPFLSRDGITKFYSRADEIALVGIFKSFLTDPKKLKVGHNIGSYDWLVLFGKWGIDTGPLLDTILVHRSVEPEMPHNLGYCGSLYSDINRAWKSEHTAVNAKSDKELWRYNATDCAVNAHITEPLCVIARERQQWPLVQLDHKLQRVCRDMHITGLLVDRKRRDHWDAYLLHEAIKHRRECQEVVGSSDFNPASVFQIRDLLYSDWDLPILNRTKSDDPSTDDDTLRGLMLEPGLTPQQRSFLQSLRMFRRRAKLRGTYVVKLKSRGQIYQLDPFAIEEDEDLEDYRNEEELWRARDEKKEGILDKDGRVRSSWNVHGTNTGRFSSSGPNMQNFPRKMRDMIIPGPGHAFVYADMDQLELRLATMFSRATVYEKVFAAGGDPHSTSTLLVMGKSCHKIYNAAVAKYGNAKTARKKDENWSKLCDFGKCVIGSTRVPVRGIGSARIRDLMPLGMLPGQTLPAAIPLLGSTGQAVAADAVYYGGKQPTIKIILDCGIELGGTAKHQLMLIDDSWRRLDALQIGDRLKIGAALAEFGDYQRVSINPWVVKASKNAVRSVGAHRSVDHTAVGLPAITIDEHWGYLLGALHGDGCVSDGFVTLVGLPDDGVVDAVEAIYRRIGMAPTRIIRKPSQRKLKELHNINVASVAFIDFLQRIGFAGPKTKKAPGEWAPRKIMRVPETIFRSPRTVILNYLAGLMDTDGSVGDGGWEITMKDREYIQDVQQLLLLIGIQSRTTDKWNQQYQKNYRRLCIARGGARIFADVAGPMMKCRRKMERFDGLAKTWGSEVHDSGWNEIVNISAGECEEVFDVHVPDGNAFVANGLVNHNTFTYAAIYKAKIETVMETLRSAEDKNENLIYADLTLDKAQQSYDNWLGALPEIPIWWRRCVEKYRQDGYILDSMTGRRCDFNDGEEENQIINFGCQATGAGIVNTATLEVVEEIPREKYGRNTGLCQQGHDALMLEVPVGKIAEHSQKVLESCMHKQVPGFTNMDFTAGAKVLHEEVKDKAGNKTGQIRRDWGLA